ncbi:MAG: MarC family protein [Bacteroidia bacterium]|nr:MarC family protein [Bacteroidia bacterium]
MDFNLQETITITFTLFAVIDVIGSVPILISLKEKTGSIHAGQATLVAGILMTLFFFVGEKFLGFLGIDIHSFALAGSIVIFIIGLEMVLGRDFFHTDPDLKSGSIVPVAFPIIAGSGTLTTIMSLKSQYHAVNIYAAIILNLIFVFVVISSTGKIEKLLGKNGLLVIRKFFGVILIAIAVKLFKTNFSA